MLYFFSKKIFLEGEMRKTKRIFVFVLALFLAVTGIYLPEMQAKAETAPVLKVGPSWENGLVNIWSGLADQQIVC